MCASVSSWYSSKTSPTTKGSVSCHASPASQRKSPRVLLRCTFYKRGFMSHPFERCYRVIVCSCCLLSKKSFSKEPGGNRTHDRAHDSHVSTTTTGSCCLFHLIYSWLRAANRTRNLSWCVLALRTTPVANCTMHLRRRPSVGFFCPNPLPSGKQLGCCWCLWCHGMP